MREKGTLELALAARVPLVLTSTADTAHFESVLVRLSEKRAVHNFHAAAARGFGQEKEAVVWSLGDSPWSSGNTTGKTAKGDDFWYHHLQEKGSTFVLVNAAKSKGPMWFDAGTAPVPPELVFEMLVTVGLAPAKIKEIEPAIGGLTLKEIRWVVQLAQGTYKKVTRANVSEVRRSIFPERRGLVPVDTRADFYVEDAELSAWVAREGAYLTHADERLRPRGLLLYGPPGTGKTAGAKFVARAWGLPLYRLEMGRVKNKWVGNSEANMLGLLREIDREAPCVLLIDEVEKLFATAHDSGTTSTLLASLLWWLSEHRSPVVTMMTTNAASAIPPELIRDGRLDGRVRMEGVPAKDVDDFVLAMLDTFGVTPKQVGKIDLPDKQTIEQAVIEAAVKKAIKAKGAK